MEIDFLALLEFVQNKRDADIYEKLISQINMLQSNPGKEIEISIPKELIEEFIGLSRNVECARM